MNLHEPVSMTVIVATIGVLIVLFGIGIIFVKNHPNAKRQKEEGETR